MLRVQTCPDRADNGPACYTVSVPKSDALHTKTETHTRAVHRAAVWPRPETERYDR